MSIPRLRDVSETELRASAQALLDAAYAYWKIMQEAGEGGALFWLDDCAGHTVIFTRGEYRSTLMSNVDQLRFEGVKLRTFNLDAHPESGIEAAEDADLAADTGLYKDADHA